MSCERIVACNCEYCGPYDGSPVGERQKFVLSSCADAPVCQIKFDKMIVNQKACDYLFLVKHQTKPEIVLRSYFVELKASHVDDAIEQLLSSIKYCHDHGVNLNKLKCVVVMTKEQNPNIRTTSYKRLTNLLKNQDHKQPIIATGNAEKPFAMSC